MDERLDRRDGRCGQGNAGTNHAAYERSSKGKAMIRKVEVYIGHEGCYYKDEAEAVASLIAYETEDDIREVITGSAHYPALRNAILRAAELIRNAE